jgi:hypothetical protein
MTDELVLTRSWPMVEPGSRRGADRTVPLRSAVQPSTVVPSARWIPVAGAAGRRGSAPTDGRPGTMTNVMPMSDYSCEGRGDLRTKLPADILHSDAFTIICGARTTIIPHGKRRLEIETASTLPDNRPVPGWNRTSRWPAVTCTRWRPGPVRPPPGRVGRASRASSPELLQPFLLSSTSSFLALLRTNSHDQHRPSWRRARRPPAGAGPTLKMRYAL